VKIFWTERDFLCNVAVLLLLYVSFVLFVSFVPLNIFYLIHFLFMSFLPFSIMFSCYSYSVLDRSYMDL